MSDKTHDIKKEVKTYIVVFVALAALTVITVALSYLKVSVAVGITIALIVATFKASLVACYFMHLISEKKLIYLVLTFTVVCFAGLMIVPITETYNTPEGTQHLKIQNQSHDEPHHGS